LSLEEAGQAYANPERRSILSPMSDLLILMAGAALPSLVIIIWFYRMDRLRPEPVGLIGRSVLFGFLAAAPAIAIELVVDLPASALPFPLSIIWTAFITAALVEEGVKYFFLKRYLYTNKHFNEVMDGILYAVCVSLGFAFAENITVWLGRQQRALASRLYRRAYACGGHRHHGLLSGPGQAQRARS
jgi:protease PrsW